MKAFQPGSTTSFRHPHGERERPGQARPTCGCLEFVEHPGAQEPHRHICDNLVVVRKDSAKNHLGCLQVAAASFESSAPGTLKAMIATPVMGTGKRTESGKHTLNGSMAQAII